MTMPKDKLLETSTTFFAGNTDKAFRVACLGDIHLANSVGIKDVNKILWALDESNPNIILYAGDFVDTTDAFNDGKTYNNLFRLLSESASLAPTYGVVGNHDIFKYENGIISRQPRDDVWRDLNGISGLHICADGIESNGELCSTPQANIFGFNAGYYSYYGTKEDRENDFFDSLSAQDITSIPTDKPTIFLIHSPEFINDPRAQALLRKFNVVVAGHYHNGCTPNWMSSLLGSENRGLYTPEGKILSDGVRGIVNLDNGNYMVCSGGYAKITDIHSKLNCLDSLFCRQMDVLDVQPADFRGFIKKNSYKRTRKFPK